MLIVCEWKAYGLYEAFIYLPALVSRGKVPVNP
jgi:hypothetical protein